MQNSRQNTSGYANSLFGQLVYVTSLREGSCGRYREPLAESIFGELSVHRRLSRLHVKLFREWLALTLERQVADLEQYFPANPVVRKEVLGAWARFSRYKELIPPGVARPERLLFVCNLDVALELLRAELEPASVGRSAATRRTRMLHEAWRLQLSH